MRSELYGVDGLDEEEENVELEEKEEEMFERNFERGGNVLQSPLGLMRRIKVF